MDRLNGILNTLAHWAVSLAARQVHRSSTQKDTQLAHSLKMQQEIAAWRGAGEAEVVSLGQNCSTAWYIKVTGQKKASYPFDWVTTSPGIILHCLGDRFQTLLDRNQMVSRGLRAGHAFYHSGYFGHRNPKASQHDYEYFCRCAARMMDLINGKRPVIFVTTVLNEVEKRPVWAEGFVNAFPRPDRQTVQDFTEMMDAIRAVDPHVRFLFIEEYTEQPFGLDILHQTDNMLWIRNCAMGRSTGVRFLDPVDDAVARNLFLGLSSSDPTDG